MLEIYSSDADKAGLITFCNSVKNLSLLAAEAVKYSSKSAFYFRAFKDNLQSLGIFRVVCQALYFLSQPLGNSFI